MAVIKKTLFAENLDRYQTFVNDTDVNSEYFKITELSDTFTGGKNAFLIQGSEYLVPDTLIKIEIKDAQGNIIYHEPGEGIVSSSVGGQPIVTEYYEGVSKVVAVYIYPDTSYGPATITILGELATYNNNGLISPIPLDWEGKYNVKWQKQINVNPSLVNTTKIRFYKRPVASISETLSPIYTIVSGSKVESNVVSSFANIKLSQMETFAGDVKRIKVFRTSLGDISDSDLIQDILVESKELLTSYELSGSVVGNGGLFTSETLQKLWIANGVTTQLTSSRIDNGVKLNGGGYFKYSSSLNLSDVSVYELGIDAFYSASTESNLGIYISGSNNGDYLIATLNGITPTKNLKDQTIQFSLPNAEPTASLYFSQSQSEWHIGNVSLKLTQDTAFSPSEIEFVTSMPTVIGNETYEFNFEFYDVNNNYVPVSVTQSALFTGGNNNVGGTISLISSSASSSLSQLYAVSSSISGTMTVYSSSADTTIVTLSGSVDTTIVTLSGSVSGSITIVSGSVVTLSGSVSASISSLSSSVSSSNAVILSSSLSKVQQLANGQYSGSFIGDTVIYSPAIGGQVGYIKELFTVGDNTSSQINLDARTSTRKIYIGTGTYNNTNTGIYLDSGGQFSLKDKLTWDGTTLTVNGNINVAGGNAATQTYANTIGTNSVLSGSASANAAQTAAQLFATGIGNDAVLSGSAAASSAQSAAIAQAKTDASASVNLLANGNWTGGSGTFITATSISSPVIAGNGGYISGLFVVGSGGAITLDGVNKKMYIGTGTHNNTNTSFYVDNAGKMSLKDKLVWDGTTLSITGNINITGGTAATDISNASTAASNAATAASTAQTKADNVQNQLTTVGSSSGSWVNPSTYTFGGGGFTLSSVVPSGAGLYLGSNYLGYYNGGSWKSYMNSSGQFYLAGSGNNGLSWDGTNLSLDGGIVARSGYIGNGASGWSINSTNISSTNGQTVLNSSGVILLKNSGGTEKVKMTYDSILPSTYSNSLVTYGDIQSDSPTSVTAGPNQYYLSSTDQYTGASLISPAFVSPSSGIPTFIFSYPNHYWYAGYGTTNFMGYITNNTNKTVQGRTEVVFEFKLYASDGVTQKGSTQYRNIFYRTYSVASGATSNLPGYEAGAVSVQFTDASVSPGETVYVRTSISMQVNGYAIYDGSYPTGTITTSTYSPPALQFTTIDMIAINEILQIGINGISVGSSDGQYAAIGTVAGSPYVGKFMGNVVISGTTVANLASSSDRRLKYDIIPITNSINKIKALNPVDFHWNKSINEYENRERGYGFIAQDVEEVFPELVHTSQIGLLNDAKSLDYTSLHGIEVAAIKELISKIEIMENKISELENKISGSI